MVLAVLQLLLLYMLLPLPCPIPAPVCPGLLKVQLLQLQQQQQQLLQCCLLQSPPVWHLQSCSRLLTGLAQAVPNHTGSVW
jgi:hypothetical protein